MCLLWGPRRLWAKRTLVNWRRGGRGGGGAGRDWDRSHCSEEGVLLLHQREGSGHHKRFRNPGSSFINRFQCQTPGSLQVGVLGRLASLGIARVISAPVFNGLHKAVPESPTKSCQLCSSPSPPAGTLGWGWLSQILPRGPQSFMLEQLRRELDQQILLAAPQQLPGHPSSTTNQLCDLGQVPAPLWASASTCVS